MPGRSTERRVPPRAEWRLVGRQDELRRLRATVVDERRSVVLAGRTGVGKSRLGQEALELCRAAGFAIARVIATRAGSRIPLGAFVPLLPVGDPPLGRVDDRATLLQRCADDLLSRARGKPLILGVDDAHLLDDMSATLVHQVAEFSSVLVMAAVRSGEPAPDPIVALWKSGLAERIELAGLGLAEVSEALVSALGGRVDEAAASELMAHSQGNMLFLRELVTGAMSDGALRDDGGIWRLVGELHPTDRLVELVEDRLAGLTAEERELMEIVAFGEPIGPAELARLSSEAVAEGLERKGLLRTSTHRARMSIRLGHPVYGDVLRDRLPGLRARAIARTLAESVEATGARRREDLLRIATWRLTGGGAEPGLMYEAAVEARWRYDFPLAEQLARAAVDEGGGFSASVLAAQLASLQGRSAQADAELAGLAALASEAGTAAEQGLVALIRLDNRVIYSGTIEEGLRIAAESEERLPPSELRDEIVARRAALLLAKEGPRSAVAAVEPLLARATGRALAWACMPGAYSLARMGRITEALEAARRGYQAQCALTTPTDWYPFMHAFYEAEALDHAGRFSEAERLSSARYQEGVQNRSLEQQAIFSWQLAKPVADRGHLDEAVRHAQKAISIYRQLDRPQFIDFCLIYLAQALALGGRPGEAREALRDLAQLGIAPSFFMGVDYLLAQGWTEAAGGNPRQARDKFVEAADEGERVGDLSALHAAARVGYATQVEQRLTGLAGSVQGELAAARAAHTRALAEGDPRGCEAASTAFEKMGATLLAAEAAADSSVCWAKVDDDRRARVSAERRATFLASMCPGVNTPALRAIETRARLTPAEWEAAQLAASGLSNREIAAELVVSVRTVENRLQHVYGKLGVGSRRALADALTAEPAG